MVKDGSAIERMAEIDIVAFDKTGTLTLGKPCLVNGKDIAPDVLAIAAEIARRSNHPLSRAIAAVGSAGDLILSEVREYPGLGMEARLQGRVYRLGRAEWALPDGGASPQTAESGTVLSCDGASVARFAFEEAARPRSRAAVDALHAAGLEVNLLSGDAADAVRAMASKLGIGSFAASLLPAQKVERLAALGAEGRKVLMVGDGLNDVPALAAAHVSMAPASAADISRNAADFVFLREGLDAVPMASAVARNAARLVRQNFALAIAYNAIALPIAIAGYVTPLIAALAMSLSSILVVANALRLDAIGHARSHDAQPDLTALASTLRAGG